MLEVGRHERTDQASGLRKLFPTRGLRVLPVTSAMQKRRPLQDLAAAFAATGQRVLILDHGWSSAGSQRSSADLAAVLHGALSFDAAVAHLGDQVRRLSVGTGFAVMNDMGISGEELFTALRKLEAAADLVIVPTGDPAVVGQLVGGHGEFLVLAEATPPGIANAYQLLKSITTAGLHVRLAFDGVEHQTAADDAFRRIETTANRFLGVFPLSAGWLPRESSAATSRAARAHASSRQALQRMALAARQWDLAEYPRARDLGHVGIAGAGDLRGLLVERSGARPAERRSHAGVDGQAEPVRTVRRSRTRREW
jgi:MinD-like ATPase involved in chromosome partitioning or flagellar assembly